MSLTIKSNCFSSECDNCARKILVSLEETSVKHDGIKPLSQDLFISKTTAKLKRLQKKSNTIKVRVNSSGTGRPLQFS